MVTQLRTDSTNIIRLQLYAALMISVASFYLADESAAQATLYGAGVALINTLLMVWRASRMARRPHLDAHYELRSFIFSGLERFVVVGLLLAAGMGPLGLDPLGVVGGFVAGQLTWLLYAVTQKKRHEHG